MSLLPFDEALARVLDGAEPGPVEEVALADALERVLAEDLRASLTQPPFPSSAMDGFAVRSGDGLTPGRTLHLIGESAAGHGFAGPVGPGQTVRIFTGAPVPDGADMILIQEHARIQGDEVHVTEAQDPGSRFIRPAGVDFRQGDVLVQAGTMLTPRHLLVVATNNCATLAVRRRPKVAILATGDELVELGGVLGPGQIVSSVPAALAALVSRFGGTPVPLGIARDTKGDLSAKVDAAAGADVLVTIGGASVGDHDLVGSVLADHGIELAFWKVAMRPGKPLMSGRLGSMRVLGVPGNPVSALICSRVFLAPLLARLTGRRDPSFGSLSLPLTCALEANAGRKHFMRARYDKTADGAQGVTATASQDSSLTATLARAECLIVREPHAPAAAAGTAVEVLPLDF